tara:strand:+ start:341 stop:490 length:150 start_codon:yes stop_codon:yes gene_type:complete
MKKTDNKTVPNKALIHLMLRTLKNRGHISSTRFRRYYLMSESQFMTLAE